MLEYTEGYVTVDGIRIYYYRTGGGKPPFVLLHGATDNGLCWTPVAELLAERYDVIMLDAQGHGFSDRLDADFTHANHTAQVVGLIQELGITSPVVMGHSMGADTTVNIAATHTSLPKAIILEDPPWGDPSPPGSERCEAAEKQVEDFRKFLIGLNKLTLEEIIKKSRKLYPGWSEEERLIWAKAKQQFDPSLFSRPTIDRSSYQELVPEIQCPALLITAENGIVTAGVAENAAKLWKSQQPFRWVQIKGAGHNIRREQFQTYCDVLLAFLKDCLD